MNTGSRPGRRLGFWSALIRVAGWVFGIFIAYSLLAILFARQEAYDG